MTVSRKILLAVVAVGLAAFVAATAANSRSGPGFKTAQGPMIDPVAAGVSYEPIISVGDTLGGGYMFESIPDGISFSRNGNGTVDLYVNHETSTVPFPYTFNRTTGTGTGFNDFTNSLVSRLRLHQRSGGVLSGSYAITSDQNFQRFCSNFLATKEHGFDRPLLLTNEEGIDWVNRAGKAWPTTIGSPAARQIGAAVADRRAERRGQADLGHGPAQPREQRRDPGLRSSGRPLRRRLVRHDSGAVAALLVHRRRLPCGLERRGRPVGVRRRRSRQLLRLHARLEHQRDGEVRQGSQADRDGTEAGRHRHGGGGRAYPPPPATGWQTDARTGAPIDGPQWILEHWGDTQAQRVFEFVRVEDIAYDRRPGMQNVLYVVDSGRGTAEPAPPGLPSPQPNRSTNGRVWKLVLDKNDPTKVTSFSILIEGDDAPVKAPNEIHQPDNIESTLGSLLITEDPGSSQQFPPGSDVPGAPNFDARATTARIWEHNLATGTKRVVAKVNQSADETPADKDANPTRGNLGAWESSGIVDVSSIFGPGAFLVDVQAGTFVIDEEVRQEGPDTLTYQRDGGQLGLLHIPDTGPIVGPGFGG